MAEVLFVTIRSPDGALIPTEHKYATNHHIIVAFLYSGNNQRPRFSKYSLTLNLNLPQPTGGHYGP